MPVLKDQFPFQIVLWSTVPFLSPRSEALANLKSVIDKSKELKVTAVRPLVLAAEENLHNMVVDLDKVVTKVRTLFYKLWTTRWKDIKQIIVHLGKSTFSLSRYEFDVQIYTYLMC